MAQRTLIVAAAAVLITCALACQNGGAGADGGGKPAPKLICKMNNQCWICPDDDAMKKCIINPATSGCKQSTTGECGQ